MTNSAQEEREIIFKELVEVAKLVNHYTHLKLYPCKDANQQPITLPEADYKPMQEILNQRSRKVLQRNKLLNERIERGQV